MSEVSETGELPKINEIGKTKFVELVKVLDDRESQRYNVVGWQGTSDELRSQVEGGDMYPASSFAIVAEGINRYKRGNPQMREDTDSLRGLSSILSEGSRIYEQAATVDEKELKNQIKKYVEAHGGSFNEETNWQELVGVVAKKLRDKADLIDEANR